MAVCADCTTPHPDDLKRCPHCGGTERKQEENEMPSISRHGGVTDAADLVDDDQDAGVVDERELDPTRIVHGELQPVEPTGDVDDGDDQGDGGQAEVHGPDDASVNAGPDADQLPKPNASKAEWVAAAIRLGWSQEDAEARTRDQLAEELTR